MKAVFLVLVLGVALWNQACAVKVVVAKGKALVPESSVRCIAAREDAEAAVTVDCELAKPGSKEKTFVKSTIIDVSAPFARCEISPGEAKKIDFDCEPFAPVPLGSPVIKGRVVTVPAGVASCEVTGIQKCRSPSRIAVGCAGVERGSKTPVFKDAVDFELPDGGYSSCELTPKPDGGVESSCVELTDSLIEVGEPKVEDGKIILPAGAVSCKVTPKDEDEGKVDIECESAVPGCDEITFTEEQIVDLPETPFKRCIIKATDGEGPDINCKSEVQPPVVKDGVVFLPEGSSSCEITGKENCSGLISTRAFCKVPSPSSDKPTFGKGISFALPEGYSSCTVTPGEKDGVSSDCVEAPVVPTIEGKVKGKSIVIPAGVASCTINNKSTVACRPPTEGCVQTLFEEEATAKLPDFPFASCKYTPGKSTPLRLCKKA